MKNEGATSKPLRAHDAIPLACDYRGQGEPLLLFIHGWTCRRAYWTPQLEHFGDLYTVAAVDLPGHGDSGTGTRRNWDVAAFARDVVACVKALPAKKVILIGHSMGGAVALEAARLTNKVTAVLLIDTFVIDYGGLTAKTVDEIVSPFEGNFASAMKALIQQTATAATPLALQERLVREMASADPAWAIPVWRDLLSWSPQAAFHELQVPIHAINGALVSEESRQRCAPFVAETIIPGAGHFLHMEDPAGFNRVLAGVLAGIC